MACENMVGVKNIVLTFYDCETDNRVGPISHLLATEDLPMWRNCAWTAEKLPGGYTKRQAADAGVEINLIRDLRIPLAWYQGCVAIDMQVEYLNGIVQTGVGGGVVGDPKSDTHEVEMELTFRTVDELLPPGSLVNA